MTKFLKPKNMRRLALLAVLSAPIIYLFGGLFTGLIGAHGEIVFSDDVTSSYVEFDSSSNIKSDKLMFVWDTFKPNLDIYLDFVSNGESFKRIYSNAGSIYYYRDAYNVGVYVNNRWVGDYTSFTFDFSDYFLISSLVDNGTFYSFVPNPKDNADFVFGQMFPDDNFVSKIGEDVFSGDISSQPICELIQYVDENMFDVSQYSWGKFLYGYVYYAVTSVLIYEVVAISLSLLLMPLKVVDLFEERTQL